MLETPYAGRSVILAHMIGPGRSRAVWICPWRALHDPGLVVGISIALQRNILGAGDQEIRKGGNSEGLAKASV